MDTANEAVNTLILIFTLLAGSILGLQAGDRTAPWVHTAHGLRFTIKPTKSVFYSDEPVIVDFIYTNVGKTPKILETGGVFTKHSIHVFRDGEGIPPDVLRIGVGPLGAWSSRPSGPIPRGGNLTEKLDIVQTRNVSKAGTYRVTARKMFRPTIEYGEIKNPRLGVDYLEAETTFRVIPAVQGQWRAKVPAELRYSLKDNDWIVPIEFKNVSKARQQISRANGALMYRVTGNAVAADGTGGEAIKIRSMPVYAAASKYGHAKPGQTVSTEFDIRDWLLIDKPGTYRVNLERLLSWSDAIDNAMGRPVEKTMPVGEFTIHVGP